MGRNVRRDDEQSYWPRRRRVLFSDSCLHPSESRSLIAANPQAGFPRLGPPICQAFLLRRLVRSGRISARPSQLIGPVEVKVQRIGIVSARIGVVRRRMLSEMPQRMIQFGPRSVFGSVGGPSQPRPSQRVPAVRSGAGRMQLEYQPRCSKWFSLMAIRI